MESPKVFFSKCVRVWKVLRKPSREEFLTIAKVSAVGILIIGLVGFIIATIIRFFLK
ncbi:protein translocase SEC61 complex subunit gamma [Candidatus Pacearchaeota archaeon CG10_big_fil_rev_8_21_14_0_10_31_9]|nr:MAG: protein translocase SEC61 complex subunit gamma [Candidatus Pacearchaeota archaeon CG1_02_32_21]PIN94229.1 MAG: protein translocase SEC61 complex subunit gamma [Candidatus Pacearchaeota archaeon CG10_big_fil_rev_8_21_14_0_10_31_9]PIZ82988.1 MAG: protein translocase SEC61 complex subunit gamma [Candidatus Pacearchaeota archaeon CG_4_10_14_0_2_um_filter_05_32_18]